MNTLTDIMIRKATPGEALAISSLLYNSFLDYRSFYTQKAFEASTPDIQKVKERIERKNVWVAICDEKIVGTVSGVSLGRDFYIRSIAVDPNFRGTGVAKELMSKMETIAQKNKCKDLKLTSASFLIPAMNLYKSLGFIEAGYKNVHGTTLIKMIKPLENNF